MCFYLKRFAQYYINTHYKQILPAVFFPVPQPPRICVTKAFLWYGFAVKLIICFWFYFDVAGDKYKYYAADLQEKHVDSDGQTKLVVREYQTGDGLVFHGDGLTYGVLHGIAHGPEGQRGLLVMRVYTHAELAAEAGMQYNSCLHVLSHCGCVHNWCHPAGGRCTQGMGLT